MDPTGRPAERGPRRRPFAGEATPMGDAHTVVATRAAEPVSRRARDVDSFCEACGYTLRGQTARRCPECGRPFSAGTAGCSRIPWEHRHRLGPVRAYGN